MCGAFYCLVNIKRAYNHNNNVHDNERDLSRNEYKISCTTWLGGGRRVQQSVSWCSYQTEQIKVFHLWPAVGSNSWNCSWKHCIWLRHLWIVDNSVVGWWYWTWCDVVGICLEHCVGGKYIHVIDGRGHSVLALCNAAHIVFEWLPYTRQWYSCWLCCDGLGVVTDRSVHYCWV